MIKSAMRVAPERGDKMLVRCRVNQNLLANGGASKVTRKQFLQLDRLECRSQSTKGSRSVARRRSWLSHSTRMPDCHLSEIPLVPLAQQARLVPSWQVPVHARQHRAG